MAGFEATEQPVYFWAKRIHCAGHTSFLALHRGSHPDDHELMRTKAVAAMTSKVLMHRSWEQM